MNAELARKRLETALKRADNTRRDPGGMPVHAHHGAERLEPEWVRQAAQQFIAPVVVDDRLANYCAKPRHPIGQPFWDVATMQRQIGAAGFASHQPDGSEARGCGGECIVFIPINMASLPPSGNAAGARRCLPTRSMGRS